MASFGVALPLSLDTADGFVMLKDIRNLAKQNLKMLILTLPGERVMKPKFGVGLSKKKKKKKPLAQGTYTTEERDQILAALAKV